MSEPSDENTAAEAEILALEASIYGNPSARHDVGHLLAPEFWEVTEAGDKVDRELLMERLAANPMIVDSYPVEDTRVDLYGDVAISTGHATLHGRMPMEDGGEKEIVRPSRFVHIWVRHGDTWKVVYSHSSASSAPR